MILDTTFLIDLMGGDKKAIEKIKELGRGGAPDHYCSKLV